MSFLNQICRQVTHGKYFPKDLEYIFLPLLLQEKHPHRSLLQDISMLKEQDVMTQSPLIPEIYLMAVNRTFITIPKKMNNSEIKYENTYWSRDTKWRSCSVRIINKIRNSAVLSISSTSKFGSKKNVMKLVPINNSSSEIEKETYRNTKKYLENYIDKELQKWNKYQMGDQWTNGIPGFIWYENYQGEKCILQNSS